MGGGAYFDGFYLPHFYTIPLSWAEPTEKLGLSTSSPPRSTSIRMEQSELLELDNSEILPKLSPSDESNDVPTSKEVTENSVDANTSAAVKLQAAWRGYAVRRSEILNKLKIVKSIGDAVKRLEDEEGLTDSEGLEKVGRDEKLRLKVSELLMAQLLKLDTVQSSIEEVRASRKELSRKINKLLDLLEEIKTNERSGSSSCKDGENNDKVNKQEEATTEKVHGGEIQSKGSESEIQECKNEEGELCEIEDEKEDKEENSREENNEYEEGKKEEQEVIKDEKKELARERDENREVFSNKNNTAISQLLVENQILRALLERESTLRQELKKKLENMEAMVEKLLVQKENQKEKFFEQVKPNPLTHYHANPMFYQSTNDGPAISGDEEKMFLSSPTRQTAPFFWNSGYYPLKFAF